ncbi:hypothetical protein RCE97_17785 [Klebsiella pneumoniae]|nr:hypothetical protein [Klebsiella pneumoniae]
MEKQKISKERFVSDYCEMSGITSAVFYSHGDAVPCDCGESCCDGWAYLSHEKITRDKKYQSIIYQD